jgi:hypothetical protein
MDQIEPGTAKKKPGIVCLYVKQIWNCFKLGKDLILLLIQDGKNGFKFCV